MLPLCSHLPWWVVAEAEAASLVVTLPRIQRFPFVFKLALTDANLFVAMAALGEAQLVGGVSGLGDSCLSCFALLRTAIIDSRSLASSQAVRSLSSLFIT